MKRALEAPRGSALIGVMAMMAILFGFVLAVMVYSGQERRRAIYTARQTNREDCAHAGLELSRSYFGRNFKSWNTYLTNPGLFNPILNTVYNPVPVDPKKPPAGLAPYPGLFADLDGDNKPDVFLYIRDNEDEFPIGKNDFTHDNDQTVIAGAMCISSTMAPRRENGQVDSDPVVVEGLLSYSLNCSVYNQSAGGQGNGNLNCQ